MLVPDDEPLMRLINQALRSLHETGELRKIYERYGIWNDTQEQLPDVWKNWNSDRQQDTQDRWLTLARQVPLLVKAAGVTVALALTAMPLAVLIGVGVVTRSVGLSAEDILKPI